MGPIDVFIGVGSNLGDRVGAVHRAVGLLRSVDGVGELELSRLYESAPWGKVDQPPFVNAVVHVRTVLGPVQLLIVLRTIELKLGRVPSDRWGPRSIDLDILLYGDVTIRRRGLTIPHAAMDERAFVLAPLRDLLPSYQCANGEGIDRRLERIRTLQNVEPINDGSLASNVR